ncbi:proton-coupled folate transporter-like [Argonauta hians]
MVTIKNLVEPVIFMYMIPETLTLIALQSLVYDRTCQEYYDQSMCRVLNNGSFHEKETIIQEESSEEILELLIGFLVPSTIAAMFLGPFGDIYSRKIVLILPLIGNIISHFIFMITASFVSIPMSLLFLGVIIRGCFGGTIIMMMALYTYVIHTADLKNRTVRIGILQAMSFIATTVGMLVSGILLDSINYTAMFGLIIILNIINLSYTVIVIEELIKTDQSILSTCKHIFQIQHVRSLFEFISKKRKSTERAIIMFGILITAIVILITRGEVPVIQLFLRHFPISADVNQVGYFFSLQNFVFGIALMTAFPILKKVLFVSDLYLSLSGFIAQGIGSVMFGLAPNIEVAFAVPVLRMPLGFTYAIMRSVASTFVNIDEEAKLFTIFAYLENLMPLVASVCFNGLYSLTFDIHEGYVFFVATAICAISCLLTVVMWHQIDENKKYESLQEEILDENHQLKTKE